MRHNKKRNTALLYEFLIRHISKCLVESKEAEANKAVAILKRHFSKNSVLHEELSLFDSIFKHKVKSLPYAAKVLNQILSESSKLNPKALTDAKTKLIKEINQEFDTEAFYSHKIPNYVIYASAQSLFSRRKEISPIDRLKLEEKIVTFLTEEKGAHQSLAQTLKLDPKYSNAVYKIVLKKFDEKYAESLNENQKKLLGKYAVSLFSENKRIFSNAVKQEMENVRSSIGGIADPEVAKDKDLMHKIQECREHLNEIDTENMTEQSIVRLLQFMKLADTVAN